MKRASDRLSRIPPSATLGISARARELRSEGKDVISFGAGEPDFATPEHVVAAAARACYDLENHKYTASAGLRPLREAIADDVGRYSGVDVDWSEAVLVIPPKKKAISIRVDEDVLDYFKHEGAGYQRRMNAVLRSYVEQKRKAPPRKKKRA